MVSYEYYRDVYRGILSEEDFTHLEPKACDVIEAYITGLLSINDVKPLDKYEFDLSKSICYEVDMLNTVGEGVLNGEASALDMGINTVKTENFTYTMENKSKFDTVHGIPISPVASSSIMANLRYYGYFNKVVKQCLKHREY